MLGTDPKKIFSPERKISLGVLCVGKGGGKDWLVAIILCYVNTVLQCLRNPQRFFMIDDTLDILNVSVKGENADQVFFNKFKQRVKENKFFLININFINKTGLICDKLKVFYVFLCQYKTKTPQETT